MEKRLIIQNFILMKHILTILTLIYLFSSCTTTSSDTESIVSDEQGLKSAISNAKPGDHIVMANGSWKDISIRFYGNGTAEKPITLSAEDPGGVKIEGRSDLKLGGKHLIVSGLHFQNGSSPSSAVIQFQLNKDTIAFHSQVTNCVIEDYNQNQRNKTDLWVLFHGRNNQLVHSYLAGKSNRGPTVRVDLEGIESIDNHHIIAHNHFGPRPPKGGPSAETIQVGNSYTSMAPSYTQVSNNLFEYCNGEVEIISSKSNFNEFRNNVFYKSEGSLVTRHGNYCTLDGNYFIGDENSEQIGGIRLIGSGHWVTNNYFYKLKGQNFRSPLAVMNGIPKSPLNRYIQVTDVVVAYNSWIDCQAPLQFGVGSNIDQREVLPASEIRSERPIRTTVANNLIFNQEGDPTPIVAHDQLDGITFKNNYINNNSLTYANDEHLLSSNFTLSEINEYLYTPSADLPDTSFYSGFEFDKIDTDIFGTSRTSHNTIGAAVNINPIDPEILDPTKYGAAWYTKAEAKEPTVHTVGPNDDIASVLNAARDGDIIELSEGPFDFATSLTIDKKIIIRSGDTDGQATLRYTGASSTPAFEMNPKGDLTLQNIKLLGGGTQYAFASLKANMSSLYNLSIVNSVIQDFDYILKAYKYSFAEYIKLSGSTFKSCNNGIELSEETEDKGEYNAENIFISDCTFDGIKQNVIDYYRGGYDESTVGGNLIVSNSTFTNSGAEEKNRILLNTYGIINVKLNDNTFINNQVKLIAQLWGAKNNTYSNNTIKNSGEIRVEENLKLNLLY